MDLPTNDIKIKQRPEKQEELALPTCLTIQNNSLSSFHQFGNYTEIRQPIDSTIYYFIQNDICFNPNAKYLIPGDLYDYYCLLCRERKTIPASKSMFNKILRQLNIRPTGSGERRVFVNIDLVRQPVPIQINSRKNGITLNKDEMSKVRNYMRLNEKAFTFWCEKCSFTIPGRRSISIERVGNHLLYQMNKYLELRVKDGMDEINRKMKDMLPRMDQIQKQLVIEDQRYRQLTNEYETLAKTSSNEMIEKTLPIIIEIENVSNKRSELRAELKLIEHDCQLEIQIQNQQLLSMIEEFSVKHNGLYYEVDNKPPKPRAIISKTETFEQSSTKYMNNVEDFKVKSKVYNEQMEFNSNWMKSNNEQITRFKIYSKVSGSDIHGFILDEDYDELVSDCKWYINKKGTVNRKIRTSGTTVITRYLHRAVMEAKLNRQLNRNEKVIFVNGNKLNFLRSNLEIAKSSEATFV